MITQLEAIYENGVFRPLQPVDLPEHQRVTLTISCPNGSAALPGTPARLDDVRRILAKVNMTLAEAARSEREER
jgi:predicted DNA-binding antitoxin AbrB/MazE fold protein